VPCSADISARNRSMSLAPVSQHGASAAVGGSVASLLWAALQAASRGQPVPALTPEVVCTCLSEAAEAAASVWPVADRSHLLAFVAGVFFGLSASWWCSHGGCWFALCIQTNPLRGSQRAA